MMWEETEAKEEKRAVRLEGVAVRLEGVAVRLEGVAVRLEGVEVRLEGVAVRLEGVAVRLEGVATTQHSFMLLQSRTCNGRGVCSCNQCTGCKPPYTGQYCQSCQALDRTTCANLLCPPNLGCAKCALVNSTTCPASCPPTFLVNATTAGSISGRH